MSPLPTTAEAIPRSAQSQTLVPNNAEWASSAEWARIRPVFEQMYIDEHMTLAQVMSGLRQKHKFRATTAMYKRRIREWGLGKNLKRNEVEHILGIGAQRLAQGKPTFFVLRGRKVDMHDVRVFQRRSKLHTGDAIAAYAAGRSRECQDLRALTPVNFDSSTWKTPDRDYESALLAFSAMFHGLVDTSYYWIEASEIVMPPSILRGDISDVCSSLVVSTSIGDLNMVAVRKLAILLETLVLSEDAWIHCRFIYIMWVLSKAGHQLIVQTLLTHLNGLVAAYLNQPGAQYRFVQFYSSLKTSHITKLAPDMISLKADMVRKFQVESDPVAFALRSLDYDVFWRRREQGDGIDASRCIDLLERCHLVLGPLAVETLTVLHAVLQDDMAGPAESRALAHLLIFLSDTEKLTLRESPPQFIFDGQPLGMEAASELAYVYCQLGFHDMEAWIFSRLLVHQRQTASGLRREYSLLVHISRCGYLSQGDYGPGWLRRKEDIEDFWRTEVEAAAPTSELLATAKPEHCLTTLISRPIATG